MQFVLIGWIFQYVPLPSHWSSAPSVTVNDFGGLERIRKELVKTICAAVAPPSAPTTEEPTADPTPVPTTEPTPVPTAEPTAACSETPIPFYEFGMCGAELAALSDNIPVKCSPQCKVLMQRFVATCDFQQQTGPAGQEIFQTLGKICGGLIIPPPPVVVTDVPETETTIPPIPPNTPAPLPNLVWPLFLSVLKTNAMWPHEVSGLSAPPFFCNANCKMLKFVVGRAVSHKCHRTFL